MKKSVLMLLGIVVISLFLISCAPKELSEEELQELDEQLENLSDEELQEIAAGSEEGKALAGEAIKKVSIALKIKVPPTIAQERAKAALEKKKPVCGDGECSPIETEIDCPQDCKLKLVDCTIKPADSIPYLFDYDSLSDVKDKIIQTKDEFQFEGKKFKINGLEDLCKVFAVYNPYNPSSAEEILKGYSILEAEKNLIRNTAHALWVEKYGGFPWSLKDYTKTNIDFLIGRGPYYSTKTEKWAQAMNKELPEVWFYSATLGNNGSYFPFGNERIYRIFPLTNCLVKGTNNQQESAEKIIGWVEKNFMHAYYEYTWEVYGCSKWQGCVVSLDAFFKERVGGCDESSGVLAMMLRSINIPAVDMMLTGHGATYIPTLDLYIHGDFLADFTILPPTMMPMTKEELLKWINDSSKGGGYVIFENYMRENYPQYELNLKRDENSLYIEDDFGKCMSFVELEPYKQYYDTQLPEFNISFIPDGNCYEVTSKKVKIQSLDELSNACKPSMK